MVDDELLERIRQGDPGAFRELFDRYWRPLVRYALRLRGTEDEAEEAAQAAFIRLWEKREEWRSAGSVRGLLFRITRDTALNARLFELRKEDALVLGLNVTSDGRHVVMPVQAKRLAEQFARAGFEPVPVDVSELLKAGGGVKCATLELHASAVAQPLSQSHAQPVQPASGR